MFSWLEKIKKEPSHKKRFVAFSISILFTGILFVVWLSVWLPNMNKKEEIAQKARSFESPKDSFFQNIAVAWQGITNQYSDLKDFLSGVDISKRLTGNINYQSATNTPEISIIEVKSSISTPTVNH